MLERILVHLKNWFRRERFTGQFVISGGALDRPVLPHGQYYRIIGSVFNDGLHQACCDRLVDETFTGEVWALAVPQAVVDLASRAEEWENANAKALNSAYQSESFGGYSYTKATTKDGAPLSWKDAFRAELNAWRKI